MEIYLLIAAGIIAALELTVIIMLAVRGGDKGTRDDLRRLEKYVGDEFSRNRKETADSLRDRRTRPAARARAPSAAPRRIFIGLLVSVVGTSSGLEPARPAPGRDGPCGRRISGCRHPPARAWRARGPPSPARPPPRRGHGPVVLL